MVAVAANGYRLAGVLAALSAAVWFDFFLTQPYQRSLGLPAWTPFGFVWSGRRKGTSGFLVADDG